MNVGSTFTGIGGIDLGLERAGMRIVWQCESDAYRREVLARRFPGVPCCEDIREINPAARPAWIGTGRRAVGGDGLRATADATLIDAEGIDLLCGGFPCQDVSVAGRRAGLAGSRSGLFYEFARIAESLRPRWLLVENVPGLLSSHGGRDFGVVLGALADLGYGLGWRILDSRFFGVPQRRRRVFIVGTLADGDPRAAAERAGQVLAVGTRCKGHSSTRGEAREEVTGTLGGGSGNRGFCDDFDRSGAFVTSFYMIQDPIDELDGTPSLGRKSGGRSDQGQNTNYVPAGFGVRRLTPRECERLQGFPDNWTDGPDSRRYAALGDAVTVNVAEWIGRRILAAKGT